MDRLFESVSSDFILLSFIAIPLSLGFAFYDWVIGAAYMHIALAEAYLMWMLITVSALLFDVLINFCDCDE